MNEAKVYRCYVGGEWVEGGGRPIKVENPATGEIVGVIASLDPGGVRDALQKAWEAFQSWKRLTGRERGQYLFEVAEQLSRRSAEAADVITAENGKPRSEALAEVNGTIDHLRWFAEEARRGYGRIVPHQVQNKRHWVIKQPVGPVGAIAPWNFPLLLSARKVAPALAAGCTGLLKPSSRTPLCEVLLAECFEAAAVPAGVLNLVCGPSAEIADEMLKSPLCRKISFTGSTPVGKELMGKAAETVTNISLELGGHAPVLVFDDVDLERAVDGVLNAKFRNTGQSCIAANRIYVQEGIYDDFLSAFVDRVRSLKVGPGTEAGVEVGPMIDGTALQKALSHIEDAVAKGAAVLCGGGRLTGEPHARGHFLAPTVLAGATEDMLCMREETFAPVAPVVSFSSYEEAVRKANDTIYGLSAYVFTNDLDTAIRAAEDLEAGTIGLNDGVPATSQCPFGGYKQSGLGRELGIEGMEAFLETKHISVGLKG